MKKTIKETLLAVLSTTDNNTNLLNNRFNTLKMHGSYYSRLIGELRTNSSLRRLVPRWGTFRH